MLVVPDRALLDDGSLDLKESVEKLTEENAQRTAHYKIANQDELSDADRSFGPRMPYQEVIRRIRLENPYIRVRDGIAGNVALYIEKTAKEKAEDGIDPSRSDFGNDHKYVGGFPTEELPEYSHLILDERGLPKREVRGWRSVLMNLIKAGVLSYSQAVRQFGEANGQRSILWHSQMQKYRR